MFRVTDTWATVFRPEEKEKSVKANISTAEKLKEPIKNAKGEDTLYRNSNWNGALFVGKDAFEKAKQLKDRDRIKIVRGGVRIDPYEKDGQKYYPPRPVIFEFLFENEVNNGNSGQGDDDPV